MRGERRRRPRGGYNRDIGRRGAKPKRDDMEGELNREGRWQLARKMTAVSERRRWSQLQARNDTTANNAMQGYQVRQHRYGRLSFA